MSLNIVTCDHICRSGTSICPSKNKYPTQNKNLMFIPFDIEEEYIGSTGLLSKLNADNIIVFDDLSTDQTANITKRTSVKAIVQNENSGKGSALKTGFKAPIDMDADIILKRDLDGRHNLNDISKLLAPIIEEKNGGIF
jgi:hypothetical protein